MAKKPPKTTPAQVEKAKREEEILAMRVKGHTLQEVADVYFSGDRSNASRAIRRYLMKSAKESERSVEQLRQLENMRLDMALPSVIGVLQEIQHDPASMTEEMARAVSALVRLSKRRSDLNGLDTPVAYGQAGGNVSVSFSGFMETGARAEAELETEPEGDDEDEE